VVVDGASDPAAPGRAAGRREPRAARDRTVLVVAPETLFGETLAGALGERFTVVGVASTMEDALRQIAECGPRLGVVLHERLSRISLEAACTGLVAQFPGTAFLLLFRELAPRDLLFACQQGVRGLYDTTIGRTELLQAVETVAAGEMAIQPEILPIVLRGRLQEPGVESPTELTATQLRALALLSRGYGSKEIARLTNTTTAAVNHSLERVTRRLGASHRAEAVARAFRLGLLS
jgi:DNA-binding NarL/FixJ family response regulator